METILMKSDIDPSLWNIAQLAGWLIVFYTSLTILLLCFILIRRGIAYYQANKNENLMLRYEEVLLEMIIGEQKRNDPRAYRIQVDQLRTAFQGAAMESLRELLLLLGRDLSGDNLNLLRELYQDLRLDLRAVNRLQAGRWHEQVAAVKELGYFNIAHALPHLADLSNDPNELVRNEVQCALIRLGGPSYLDFLATLDQPLAHWHQMRILKVLKRIDPNTLPDFQTYLTNPYEPAILFILKLIRIHNQTQARSAVVDLLFDERLAVKQEAIRTLSGWLDQDTAELLMLMYSEESTSLNLSTVRALRQGIYDQKTRKFLEDIAETTPEYTLRMSALRSLKLLGGKEAIAPLAEILSEVGQRCVIHQLDDRI